MVCSGIAPEQDEAGDEQRGGSAHHEEDGVAVGCLDGRWRGARGVEALRAALGVGEGGSKDKEENAERDGVRAY